MLHFFVCSIPCFCQLWATSFYSSALRLVKPRSSKNDSRLEMTVTHFMKEIWRLRLTKRLITVPALLRLACTVIFSFSWMWTSRLITNVLSVWFLTSPEHFHWAFLIDSLVHIHQKAKIAGRIASANKPLGKHSMNLAKPVTINSIPLLFLFHLGFDAALQFIGNVGVH